MNAWHAFNSNKEIESDLLEFDKIYILHACCMFFSVITRTKDNIVHGQGLNLLKFIVILVGV